MTDNNLRIDIIPRDLYYHEVAYVRGLEKRIEVLEAALRSIANKCPATCDMTLAHEMTHEMAQEAEEALAALDKGTGK